MPLYRDEAIVLRTYKLGEADRIVVMYSKGRGKIRAVAKGVRRTKSRFGSLLEPGSIIKVQLYEGKNLDTVTQAALETPLRSFRGDLEQYARLATVLEVVDHMAIEGERNGAVYRLVVGVVTELDRSKNPLVIAAFVVKLLKLEGLQPVLDRCASCGSGSDLVSFDLQQGGVLCTSCRRGRSLSTPAREALLRIVDGQVRQVLETTAPSVATELEALTAHIIEQHLERRLKSYDTLQVSVE